MRTELVREDGMDCFALGGILISADAVPRLIEAHADFCARWKIEYPLHSNSIRCRREKFAWLGKAEQPRQQSFENELAELISTLPFLVIACVIDRSGYNARYKALYAGQRWMLCKTAFAILLERAAKFADARGDRLKVYFEKSGKREDGDVIKYLRSLKESGMPFNSDTSSAYQPLTATDFRRILTRGDPARRTKQAAMCQFADLVLYPVAKSRYVPDYRPYLHLRDEKKLIDCHLPPKKLGTLGIKYSCFDSPCAIGEKTKDPE